MPSYLTALAVAVLAGSAACADDKSPARSVTTAPAAPAASASMPQAAPQPAAPAAGPAAASGGVVRYTQAPAGSTLTFNFLQAGADSQGSFKKFTTQLSFDEKNLAASSLRVTVQVASLDTQDKERDTTLATPELLDTAKHSTATFVSTSLARRANGYEAAGKLTLRGVTKNLRVPFTLKPTANGQELAGEVTIKRLDFGIGQGEWESTEWVGSDVKLAYKVALVKAASGATL